VKVIVGLEKFMNIVMQIQPKLCGPASVGTVELIKVLRDQCHLSLAEAKNYVDRCVFEGAEAIIPIPHGVDANEIAKRIHKIETPAKIKIRIEEEAQQKH
jgi:hypothetical protein